MENKWIETRFPTEVSNRRTSTRVLIRSKKVVSKFWIQTTWQSSLFCFFWLLLEFDWWHGSETYPNQYQFSDGRARLCELLCVWALGNDAIYELGIRQCHLRTKEHRKAPTISTFAYLKIHNFIGYFQVWLLMMMCEQWLHYGFGCL